jgi:hypothetical protein
MKNFKYGTNYAVFGIFLVIATILALGIIPGLDILAWHLLKPEGYWQGLVLIAVETVTAWPRIACAFLLWAVISAFGAEVS